MFRGAVVVGKLVIGGCDSELGQWLGGGSAGGGMGMTVCQVSYLTTGVR